MTYIGFEIMGMDEIRSLIEKVDIEGLASLLARHPELANKNIGLPTQESAVAHPLHRLCDGVFAGTYTDMDAREMAKLFVASGSDVNGGKLKSNQDSPLTAAASLSAEQTAIYYVDIGASLDHRGCHGGTALHWAAWCGRDWLVKKLIQSGAPIEIKCTDFQSTPLFWAIHGLKLGGVANSHHQIQCARMLIDAGASRDTRNKDGLHVLDLLDDADADLRALLTG